MTTVAGGEGSGGVGTFKLDELTRLMLAFPLEPVLTGVADFGVVPFGVAAFGVVVREPSD